MSRETNILSLPFIDYSWIFRHNPQGSHLHVVSLWRLPPSFLFLYNNLGTFLGFSASSSPMCGCFPYQGLWTNMVQRSWVHQGKFSIFGHPTHNHKFFKAHKIQRGRYQYLLWIGHENLVRLNARYYSFCSLHLIL